jgi:uncharacterized protein involved in copper resistance
MKTVIAKSAIFAGVFLLAACSSEAEEAPAEASGNEAVEEVAATAAAEPCTQETMMAKATELGEKMKAMASDPAAMQEMAGKMQDIQAKVQQGTADGSFGIEEACAAYDELLAAT